MILGKKKRNSVKLIINTTEIEESRKVVLLGITIDKFLIFNEHIDNLCRVANYKVHALRRIRKYLSLEKAKPLCNAFINSQFNYAPLVWMFCRQKQYLKIQKIHHKRCCITVLKTMMNFFGIIMTFRFIKVAYVL